MSTPNDRFLSLGPYLLLEKLGYGSFASVYRCEHSLTRHQYAGKLYDIDFAISDSGYRMVRREISVLKLLRGPRMIRFHEVLYTREGVLIVMELVVGRTLLNIMPPSGGLPESFARQVFTQILEGLFFLHCNGIVHRDLKLENIMIQPDGDIKLIDFGLADYVPESARRSGLLVKDRCGSPHYYAPEVILASRRERFQGDKVDIWAAGVILYTLVSGFHPFYADDDKERTLYRQITKVKIRYGTDFSGELEHLLRQVFVKDPNFRASLREIQNHAWTNNTFLAGSADSWIQHNNSARSSTSSNLLETWPIASNRRQMSARSGDEDSISLETYDESGDAEGSQQATGSRTRSLSDWTSFTGSANSEQEADLDAGQVTRNRSRTTKSTKEKGTDTRDSVGRVDSRATGRGLCKIGWQWLKAYFKGLLGKKEKPDLGEETSVGSTARRSSGDENLPPLTTDNEKPAGASIPEFDFEGRNGSVERTASRSGPYCNVSILCFAKV